MSSKDSKMFVSDELKGLDMEIEMRKEGLFKWVSTPDGSQQVNIVHRIQCASEIYHHSLSKKKQHDELGNNEKLLPSDALGLVMIVHGEQFGENSAFGMLRCSGAISK